MVVGEQRPALGIIPRPPLRKIGITYGENTDARFRSISASTKDYEDKLEFEVRSRNPDKWEQYLHDLFSDKQRYYRPLKGNGATEVFVLNIVEVLICYWWFFVIRIEWYFGVVFILMKWAAILTVAAALVILVINVSINLNSWESFITSVLQLW